MGTFDPAMIAIVPVATVFHPVVSLPMADDGDYLAIDWGTTNRRIHRMAASGKALAAERDDRGAIGVGRGISCLPDVEGDRSRPQSFKRYPIRAVFDRFESRGDSRGA